jgi:hypothetical protein
MASGGMVQDMTMLEKRSDNYVQSRLESFCLTPNPTLNVSILHFSDMLKIMGMIVLNILEYKGGAPPVTSQP